LSTAGNLGDAIAAFRKAITLKPDYAKAYNNLGVVLRATGDIDGAITAHRKAIHINPDDALAYCNLGRALQSKGQFDEALAELRRGHELGSKDPRWRQPSQQWINDCKRLIELDKRLPAILRGLTLPSDAAEQIKFAQVCRYKQLYGASARLFGEAFQAKPELAE